jgi:uncharacterized surface protein with fasciclin (FAS1) repeats
MLLFHIKKHLKSKYLIGLLLIATLLNWSCDQEGIEENIPADPTLFELLNSHPKYSAFLRAADRAGLTSELQGNTPYTLFVPTNEAFQRANINVEQTAADVLKRVLQYHIFPGATRVGQLSNGYNKTVADVNIWLNRAVNPITGLATRIDLNEGRISTNILSNILASNGFLNEINFVATPPTNNVWQIIQQAPELQRLEEAIIRANLASALETTAPITVFAPVNTAFDTVNVANLSQEALVRLLSYHVVPGSANNNTLYYQKDLQDFAANTRIRTINNLEITVTRPGTVRLNGAANITTANVSATNGVVHRIDRVLMP